MMKIGISARKKEDFYFVKKRYLNYLKDFEVIILYPYIDICACDAYAILGGGDANPKLYKEELSLSFDMDDEIDEFDLKIIDHAIKNKKPLLGICRGIQMINIYFQGTLKQDVLNHSNKNHEIILQKQNKILPSKVIVNSYHHQVINKLGDNLEPLYLSSDNEIEAIVHKKLPILAVQFHPEMDLENDFYQQILSFFKLFLIPKSLR